jgi:hypothetical protein
MSLDALIMLAGFLVALIPFLGFPVSWHEWMFFILGISVIALGIAVRRRGKAPSVKRTARAEFVESVPAGVKAYDIEARNDTHNHTH